MSFFLIQKEKEGWWRYVLVYVKANLTCATIIEIPFYTACDDPICIYCGTDDVERLQIVAQKYPICEVCVGKKLLPMEKRTKKTKEKTSEQMETD